MLIASAQHGDQNNELDSRLAYTVVMPVAVRKKRKAPEASAGAADVSMPTATAADREMPSVSAKPTRSTGNCDLRTSPGLRASLDILEMMPGSPITGAGQGITPHKCLASSR